MGARSSQGLTGVIIHGGFIFQRLAPYGTMIFASTFNFINPFVFDFEAIHDNPDDHPNRFRDEEQAQ